MTNILGEDIPDREGLVSKLMLEPNTFLHLYGKKEPRTGRKMGHFTVLGEDLNEVKERVRKITKELWNASSGEGD